MVTTVSLVSGYWRTSRENRERRPTTRISRLTTLASTGRRMKMSVKFMALSGPIGPVAAGSTESSILTAWPLRSFTWPATTTRSPTARPLTISTRPPWAPPVVTGRRWTWG